jgi:hypothetical protein
VVEIMPSSSVPGDGIRLELRWRDRGLHLERAALARRVQLISSMTFIH